MLPRPDRNRTQQVSEKWTWLRSNLLITKNWHTLQACVALPQHFWYRSKHVFYYCIKFFSPTPHTIWSTSRQCIQFAQISQFLSNWSEKTFHIKWWLMVLMWTNFFTLFLLSLKPSKRSDLWIHIRHQRETRLKKVMRKEKIFLQTGKKGKAKLSGMRELLRPLIVLVICSRVARCNKKALL
jgi:hypothetical protein